EAEDLACPPHVLPDGDAAFVDADSQVGGPGDLVQGAGQPAAGEIAQAVDLEPRPQQASHEIGEGRAVALDPRLEFQALPDRHDGDPVASDVPTEEDGVAG